MSGEEAAYGLRGRRRERFGRGGDSFVACLLAVVVSGIAAYPTKQPLVFSSLGPTALLFFGAPMKRNASPRNAILGHLVAIAAGWVSLDLFGLLDAPNALQMGVNPRYAGAAALSVALTGAALALLKVLHPPAGATTRIVSLGCSPRRPSWP